MPLGKLQELGGEIHSSCLKHELSKLFSIEPVDLHVRYVIQLQPKSYVYSNKVIYNMLSVAQVASVRARQMYFSLGMHEYKNEGALICNTVGLHEYVLQYRMHEYNGEGALICNIVGMYKFTKHTGLLQVGIHTFTILKA